MSMVAGRPVEATHPGVHRARGLVRARDPLALILGGEERPSIFATAAGIALALHVAMLGIAIAGGWLKDIRMAVEDNRARLHDLFWRQYDVEVPKKEDPPEPKVEPPPEPD